MTSVDSNFNFLCGRPHGALPPPPPPPPHPPPPSPTSTCVHLSLPPSPLRVDVINGWPLRLVDILIQLPSNKISIVFWRKGQVVRSRSQVILVNFWRGQMLFQYMPTITSY